MIRVGLTGGLASGKSVVGRSFEKLGCHVIRADEIGHQLLLPGSEVHDQVLREFGTVDRKKLAAEVFAHPERLALINSIVHPAVFRREEEFLAAVEASDPNGIAVVEAAILIETGSYRRYDKIVVAVCTVDQQIERAMHRDGSTRAEAEARLNRQMPLAEKRKFADFVIDTSGSEEYTVEQTRLVYDALRSGGT